MKTMREMTPEEWGIVVMMAAATWVLWRWLQQPTRPLMGAVQSRPGLPNAIFVLTVLIVLTVVFGFGGKLGCAVLGGGFFFSFCLGVLGLGFKIGKGKKEKDKAHAGKGIKRPRRRGVRFLGILKRMQSIPPKQAIRIRFLKGQRVFSHRVRLVFNREGKLVTRISKGFAIRPRKLSPFSSARRVGSGVLLDGSRGWFRKGGRYLEPNQKNFQMADRKLGNCNTVCKKTYVAPTAKKLMSPGTRGGDMGSEGV